MRNTSITSSVRKSIVANDDYIAIPYKFSENAKAGDIVEGVGVVLYDVDKVKSPNGSIITAGIIDMRKLDKSQYPSEEQVEKIPMVKWITSKGAFFGGLVDKSDLQKAIEDAQTKSENDYTPNSWTPFNQALDKAIEVNGNSGADQDDVDQAEKELKAKQSQLVNRADFSTLNATIKTASGKKETDYTPNTWTPFNNSLTAAKSVSANLNATQPQVNSANSDLETKMKALTARANFETLKATIATADTKVEDQYTPETWTPFKQSLNAAKVIVANLNATQGEVDSANSDLNTKMESLAPKA